MEEPNPMLQIPYFVQECPVCGRAVKVLAEHDQRQMTCSHCHGDFFAVDPTSMAGEQTDVARGNPLLNRVERLLHLSHRRLAHRNWPTRGLSADV